MSANDGARTPPDIHSERHDRRTDDDSESIQEQIRRSVLKDFTAKQNPEQPLGENTSKSLEALASATEDEFDRVPDIPTDIVAYTPATPDSSSSQLHLDDNTSHEKKLSVRSNPAMSETNQVCQGTTFNRAQTKVGWSFGTASNCSNNTQGIAAQEAGRDGSYPESERINGNVGGQEYRHTQANTSKLGVPAVGSDTQLPHDVVKGVTKVPAARTSHVVAAAKSRPAKQLQCSLHTPIHSDDDDGEELPRLGRSMRSPSSAPSTEKSSGSEVSGRKGKSHIVGDRSTHVARLNEVSIDETEVSNGPRRGYQEDASGKLNSNETDCNVATSPQTINAENEEDEVVELKSTPTPSSSPPSATGTSIDEDMKCNTCLKEKPKDQFVHARRPDVTVKNCKKCRKLTGKQAYRVKKKAREAEAEAGSENQSPETTQDLSANIFQENNHDHDHDHEAIPSGSSRDDQDDTKPNNKPSNAIRCIITNDVPASTAAKSTSGISQKRPCSPTESGSVQQKKLKSSLPQVINTDAVDAEDSDNADTLSLRGGGGDFYNVRCERKLRKRAQDSANRLTESAIPPLSALTKPFDAEMSVSQAVFDLGRDYLLGKTSLSTLAIKYGLRAEELIPRARKCLLLYLCEIFPDFHKVLTCLSQDNALRRLPDGSLQQDFAQSESFKQLGQNLPDFKILFDREDMQSKLQAALGQSMVDHVDKGNAAVGEWPA